ncbi:pyridoxal-dependent decarboxylase domain protein [Dictyocaulus viviparus]|uniref:Pyridoxal-dependent decarboxylase domain protein n=1 Tax=Dictyocaulus viviparus TaxID=29172 RepID=A0A0D8X9J6_DICVI|nr:pyridoxal-dependent decarboxylase domain protein [Dictyocaulus viviparus]
MTKKNTLYGEVEAKSHRNHTAHSCIEKGCKLAMLRCRAIQPLEENNWGLTGEQIQAYIEKDLRKGLIPCLISCTLGTTATASSDKLTSISPVAKKEGIENANTINVNLTNVSDMRDWGLHLSRRFKALKVWFIMRICGVEGLRRHVIKICDMASYFETLVDQHPNLQIFTTRNFGVFTFHYTAHSETDENICCNQVADRSVIRVSMSYERSTRETIDKAFTVMKSIVEEYKRRKDDPLLLKSQPVIPTFKDNDSRSDNDDDFDGVAQTPKLTPSLENQGSSPPEAKKVSPAVLANKTTMPKQNRTTTSLASRDQQQTAKTEQVPVVPSKTASTLVVKRPPPS